MMIRAKSMLMRYIRMGARSGEVRVANELIGMVASKNKIFRI